MRPNQSQREIFVSLAGLGKGAGSGSGYEKTYAEKLDIADTALCRVDIEDDDLDSELKEKS
jgi:hypothetical protein